MQLGTITHWISWLIIALDSNTDRKIRFVLTCCSCQIVAHTEEKKCSDATATSWYLREPSVLPMSLRVSQMVVEKDSKYGLNRSV